MPNLDLRSRAELSWISAGNPDPGLSSNLDLRSRSEFARSELVANSDLDLRSRSELDSDLDLRSRAELSWISAKSQVQV